MKIEFAPVESFSQIHAAALVLEISAVVNGVGLIDDVQPDLSILLEELRANASAFDLAEEEDFLNEEGLAAENLAKEEFSQQVMGCIQNRAENLGAAYPYDFEFADGPIVTLKPAEDITAAGLATIVMSLFLVLEDRNLSQVSMADRAKFSTLFESIFELVCSLALAADNEGIVWWNGRSRSKRTFLRQLNAIRNFVGSGLVRTADQLEENQVGVNDGGVDAFGISTVNGVIGTDVVCSLLGATLQRSARRKKIVGPAELIRLNKFFINSPNLVFLGILAIPFSRREAEAQDCRDENCRYFPIETINRNLAILAAREPIGPARPFIGRLGEQLVSRTRKLADEIEITLNGVEGRFPLP